jgi:major type 1 subunit fimbrin (pilin)
MNKSLFAVAVAAVAATSLPVAARDGTINFTGEVIANTCVVVGGPGATSTVALPTINPLSLPADAATTARTRFTISVTDCDATSARAFFEADADSVDYLANALKNIHGAGGATNVGFALFDEVTNARVAIGQTTQGTEWQDLPTGAGPHDIDLGYEVAYVRIGGAVTAGPVKGTVNYTVEYQ